MSTDERLWYRVDGYFVDRLRPPDRALTEAIRDGAALPQIQVSELQAGLLSVLARSVGAHRILEIGTLFGYSTIHLARALPQDGELITMESSAEHARVAQGNIDRAGLRAKVQIRIGAALDLLPQETGTFDLVFVDADKQNNPGYLQWALELTRPGSLILIDNVVRGGQVTEASSERDDVLGTRTMVDAVAEQVRAGRLEATAVQTVGAKGYDGLLLAYVR